MATLEQIQIRLKKLQAQADAMVAKKAQSVIDQIRALMLKHGLTTDDIEKNAKTRREGHTSNGRKSSAAAKTVKTSGVGKYIDPKTGATWTGHGRAPAWIATARDRSKFLAEAPGETETDNLPKAAGKKLSASNAAGSSGQPKGAQPAKYLNRKTGATWSGRGRAPAWLAEVKDRSKFLVESGSEATATNLKEPTAKEGGTRNSAPAKKAAGDKAAKAQKSATKKVAGKKAATVTKAQVAERAVKEPATPPEPKAAKTEKRVARKTIVRKTKPAVDIAAPSELPVA
jgi:DNA-binding protein H-NS